MSLPAARFRSSLKKEERFRRGVSAFGSRCFTDVGAEKNGFSGANKVPKVIKIVAKGNPNEPRNLERHPYGTVSKNIKNGCQKMTFIEA